MRLYPYLLSLRIPSRHRAIYVWIVPPRLLRLIPLLAVVLTLVLRRRSPLSILRWRCYSHESVPCDEGDDNSALVSGLSLASVVGRWCWCACEAVCASRSLVGGRRLLPVVLHGEHLPLHLLFLLFGVLFRSYCRAHWVCSFAGETAGGKL